MTQRISRLASACALMLATGCGGATEPPTDGPPAPTGRIVFTSRRLTGVRDLFVMNAAGGTPEVVLADGFDKQAPVLSPDGRRIAFSSNQDGNPEIYVIDVDGTDLTRVTDNAADDLSPSWAPDGARLVVVRATNDAPSGLVVVHVDGSGESVIPGVSGESPAWSPDGTKIAYEQAGTTLRIVNVDGSGLRTLYAATTSAGDVAWSPDGTQLAFGGVAENQDIMVINADGTGLRNLTQTPGDAGEIQPVWSPDGAYIAFTGYRGGNQEIVRRKVDGTGEVVLTNLGAEDQHPSWSRTP